MKYAILHKAMSRCKLPYPVTAGSYGLVRSFGTQRDAYLYAQKIFGSQFSVMCVEIVEIGKAVKHMAVHCEANSGRRNARGCVIDEDKPNYRELYPGFVEGYHREIRSRKEAVTREVVRVAKIKECIEFEKQAAECGGAAEAMKAGRLNGVKPQRPDKTESQKDRELRLSIYGETGSYITPNQQIKPMEDEFV